jgi:hypothetical protein
MTWTCFHCGQRCGDTAGGYGAIIGRDEVLHASCSPLDPSARPDCYSRVTEYGEPPGALRDVDPKPVDVEDIRTDADVPTTPPDCCRQHFTLPGSAV